MDRRQMISTTALGAAGFVVGTGFAAPGCGDKEDIDFYASTIIGSLETLKTLAPNQADMLDKGIGIARTFNKAYQDGKFDTAMGLFENLTNLIRDVILAVGVGMSDGVKVTLAIADVGIRAIAVLLKRQATKPEIAEELKNRSVSPAQERQMALVQSLANPKAIDAVFEASRVRP